jgi:ABC-type sugar transport system permease subunit
MRQYENSKRESETVRRGKAATPFPARRGPGQGRAVPPRTLAQRAARHVLPIALLLPSLVLIIWLRVIPAFVAIRLSLHKTLFLQALDYIGLQRYGRLITDPSLHHSLWITVQYGILCLAISLVIGLLMALLVKKPTLFNKVLRTIFLVPWITSTLVSTMLWKWVLNAEGGLLNNALTALGLPRVSLFISPSLALAALVAITVWGQTPYVMVSFLAGLQGISQDLYEAAGLDGASRWQQLRWITVPLLQPVVAVVAVYLTLHYFTNVTIALTLTGGGPASATAIFPLYLYLAAFQQNNFGVAGALSVINIVITLPFVLIYVRQRLSKRAGEAR